MDNHLQIFRLAVGHPGDSYRCKKFVGGVNNCYLCIFTASVGEAHAAWLHWATWFLECDDHIGCSTDVGYS